MLPEKRTALLLVAAEAGLVGRAFREQGRCGRIVDGVTFSTSHTAAAYRVMESALKFGAHTHMTTVTSGGLLRPRAQDRVAARVAGMTIGAGQGIRIVSAAVPAGAQVSLVAIETYGVLLGQGERLITAEIQDSRPGLPGSHTSCMVGPRAVTALALQLRKRRIGIVPRRMGSVKEREHTR